MNAMDPKLVMVVEDNPGVREATMDALEYFNYRCAGAENGQAALEMLKSASSLPCLILLDLMMPVMNGWQFLQKVEQDPELADIPIVVISALADRHCSLQHVALCLPKPVSIDMLGELLTKLCR